MSSHTERHEEVLIRALAGEEPVGVVLKREGVDSCPTCAERLREIGALCADLDDLGEIERDEVSELSIESADVPTEGANAARRILAVAAMLVALLSISVWLIGEDPKDGGGGVVMGPDVLSDLESDGYESFRWRSTLGPMTKFEVRVFTVEGGAAITTSKRFRGNKWLPIQEESDKWPEEIRWEVHVVRPETGESEHSASSHASRSL